MTTASHIKTFCCKAMSIRCWWNSASRGVLRMVSVIDLLSDGLSSVYTFYEPDLPRARLGVYNVLWQIELCRKLDLDFVYLGYWIKDSRKMAYKTQYQPAQGLLDGIWRTFDKPDPTPPDASTGSAQAHAASKVEDDPHEIIVLPAKC